MQTRVRLLVILGLLTLFLLPLALVAPRFAQAGEKTPYVIGAVFDSSGPASPLGQPEADTAKMLAEQINARGGINGHRVDLVVYDNREPPVEGKISPGSPSSGE